MFQPHQMEIDNEKRRKKVCECCEKVDGEYVYIHKRGMFIYVNSFCSSCVEETKLISTSDYEEFHKK